MRRINADAPNPSGRTRGSPLPHLFIAVAFLVGGCGSPDKANIALRKEKQQLQNQIEELRKDQEANAARLAAYEAKDGALETLPGERLEQLFTVHKIDFGSLTGGADTDSKAPGDEALKVYLIPLDEAGDPVKATGHVTVELFDLSRANDNRIGRWEVEPRAMKGLWRSFLRLNAFVLTMPWQTPPERSNLALKVTFRDALTGRVFEKVRDIRIKPPSSIPATQPQQITAP